MKNHRLLPFPQNLAPAEAAAVQAVAKHGTFAAAAAALGRTVNGLQTTLNDARKRAKVSTTKALVELYRERTAS